MKNDATQVTLSRWTSEAMTAPTLHAQVLALRRTNSARAVAQALGIPLGRACPNFCVNGTDFN